MEVRVSVKQYLPEQSGVSKSGNNWRKQEFVGETYDEYPKKIVFGIFNGKVPMPAVGSDILVSFDISSRSWNDRNGGERWSTEISVWQIRPGSEAIPPSQQEQQQAVPDSSLYQQPQSGPNAAHAQAAPPNYDPNQHWVPQGQTPPPPPASNDDLPF